MKLAVALKRMHRIFFVLILSDRLSLALKSATFFKSHEDVVKTTKSAIPLALLIDHGPSTTRFSWLYSSRCDDRLGTQNFITRDDIIAYAEEGGDFAQLKEVDACMEVCVPLNTCIP